MARGDNKCAACGEFYGRGHRCRVASSNTPSGHPSSPVRSDTVERDEIEARVARAASSAHPFTRVSSGNTANHAGKKAEYPPPTHVRDDGTKEWRNGKGELDRIDGPALISPDGMQEWYRNGLLDREDGPARIFPNGAEMWCQSGQPHRVGGPAITYADGSQSWHWHGDLQREDGPAIIRADGTQEWWHHDIRHRTDGPAIIRPDGTEEWWHHGIRHRTDGPAIIRPDGTEEWWIDGYRSEQ